MKALRVECKGAALGNLLSRVVRNACGHCLSLPPRSNCQSLEGVGSLLEESAPEAVFMFHRQIHYYYRLSLVPWRDKGDAEEGHVAFSESGDATVVNHAGVEDDGIIGLCKLSSQRLAIRNIFCLMHAGALSKRAK